MLANNIRNDQSTNRIHKIYSIQNLCNLKNIPLTRFFSHPAVPVELSNQPSYHQKQICPNRRNRSTKSYSTYSTLYSSCEQQQLDHSLSQQKPTSGSRSVYSKPDFITVSQKFISRKIFLASIRSRRRIS